MSVGDRVERVNFVLFVLGEREPGSTEKSSAE